MKRIGFIAVLAISIIACSSSSKSDEGTEVRTADVKIEKVTESSEEDGKSKGIKWVTDIDKALKLSKKKDKPVGDRSRRLRRSQGRRPISQNVERLLSKRDDLRD